MTSQGAYRDAFEAGKVMIVPDVETLARMTTVPRERLEAALAALGRYARGEAADPLGRTKFTPLEPPYYASWVTGALAHTQGGLRIDDKARVLRRDGTAIPGLHAAGGTAAGLSGKGGRRLSARATVSANAFPSGSSPASTWPRPRGGGSSLTRLVPKAGTAPSPPSRCLVVA